MVITYEDSNKAVRALYTLRESRYEDKHLLVMLLPSIEPSTVPAGVQPLLVFVNVKSGGCQGLELISSFRKLLNPYQVFDLDNGGPLPGLYVFRHIKNYKILVCGGDGTIGWVLQCLDNVEAGQRVFQPGLCHRTPRHGQRLSAGAAVGARVHWGGGPHESVEGRDRRRGDTSGPVDRRVPPRGEDRGQEPADAKPHWSDK
ncbi:unnamed protein product [Timema podura]|uniref:DAGKc domain-containing protein n=1 Tax=Timema podura TaxID=61482 RepID=A0ABN7NDR2_TIMPD|nr:unnamed protein product [Timema podura]